MRILIVNQYFHPDLAASAQLLDELCEDLAAHHEVWVVSGRPSYNVRTTDRRGLASRERRGDVNIVRVFSTSFPRASMAGRIINYLSFLSAALFGAFIPPKPDIVMTWTDPPPVGLVGALVARIRRVPFVLSCQDIIPEVPIISGDLTNPVAIRILRSSMATILRRATRIVSIGRDMNERLVNLGVDPSKIELIPNWFDGALVKPKHGESQFRADHGWNDKFVVMHSGNFGLSQDLDTLIDAAEILRDKPDLLFALVGEGASKKRLEAKVRSLGLNNVQLLPFQPKSKLADSLTAPDLHIVSQVKGGAGFQVPSKLYGILASGRPFVASIDADSEIARVAEETASGTQVEPGEPSALADAILSARDQDPTEAGSHGRAAFEALYERKIATNSYRIMLEKAHSAAASTS